MTRAAKRLGLVNTVKHSFPARARGLLVLGLAAFSAAVPALITNSSTPRVLGILGFALILWMSDVVDEIVVSLTVLVLLPSLHLMSVQGALAGFSTSSLWLLVGVFILSAVVQYLSLDVHLAAVFVRLGRGGVLRTLLSILALLLILVFILPTSSGRVAIVVPVMEGLMSNLGIERGTAYGRVVFLMIPFVSIVSSTAVLTGAAVSIYTVDFLGHAAGAAISWLDWALAMFPVAMLSGILVLPILWFLNTPSRVPIAPIPSLPEPRPLSGEQRRLGVLLAVLVAAYFVSSWAHLDITIITLAAALISIIPPFSGVRWKHIEGRIPWDLVVLYGAALALAKALEEHGAFSDVLGELAPWLTNLDPALIAAMLLVVMAALRMAFNSMVGAAATVLPLVLQMAHIMHINPVWLCLVTVLGTDLALFLPTQSSAGMIAYRAGFYSIRDSVKSAIPVTAVMIGITVFLSRFYWPLVGIDIY